MSGQARRTSTKSDPALVPGAALRSAASKYNEVIVWQTVRSLTWSVHREYLCHVISRERVPPQTSQELTRDREIRGVEIHPPFRRPRNFGLYLRECRRSSRQQMIAATRNTIPMPAKMKCHATLIHAAC